MNYKENQEESRKKKVIQLYLIRTYYSIKSRNDFHPIINLPLQQAIKMNRKKERVKRISKGTLH